MTQCPDKKGSSSKTLIVSLKQVASSEGPGWRAEEESSFWKISAERTRLEGEQADFQSLTPSQIKSLEKGEKPLPSYLRLVGEKNITCGSLNRAATCSKFMSCTFSMCNWICVPFLVEMSVSSCHLL